MKAAAPHLSAGRSLVTSGRDRAEAGIATATRLASGSTQLSSGRAAEKRAERAEPPPTGHTADQLLRCRCFSSGAADLHTATQRAV